LLNKFEDLVTEEERKNIPKQIKVPVDEDGFIDNIFFAERKIPDFTLSRNANIDDFTYRKDSLKKSVATKFIGRGVKGSSTDLYRQDYEKVGLANTGEYDLLDIVFVSTNGNRPNRLPFFKSEILKAIRANASFVLDSSSQVPDRVSSETLVVDTEKTRPDRLVMKKVEEKPQYNIGELEVRRFLIENGYTEKISGTQEKINLSVSYFVPRQDNRGQFVQLDPIGKTFAKIMDRYTSLGLPFTTVEKKYEKIKQFLTSFGYTPRKVDVFLGEKGEKLEKLYNSILPKDAKGEPATEFRDILTAKKFNINKAVEFILTKTPLTARIERKSKEQDYTERQIVGRTGRPVKPYKISRDGKVTLSELYKFKNRLHLREDANNILRALIGAVPAKDSVRKESNGYQLSYVLTNKNVYNLTDEQRATILKQIVTPRSVGIDLYIKESNMNKKRQGKKKDDDDGYLSRQILLNNITNHTYYSAKQNPIYKIIINNKIKKILLENRPVRVQNVQVKTPDGKVKYLNNRQTNDDFTLTVEEMQNALYEYGQNIFNFIQKKYIKANVEQQQDEIEKLIKFTDKQFKAFEKAFERLRTGYNERMYDGNLKDKKYENPFIKEVNSLRKKYTVTPEGLLIRKDFVNKNTKKLQEIFGTYDKRLEFFTPVIARIDKMIEQGIGDPSAEQDIKIYNRLIAELQEAVESYEDSDFTPSQYEEYRASVKETIKRYQDKVPYIPYIPFDDGQYVLSSEELNIDISTGRMKDEVPPEQFSDNLIRAISKLSEEVEKVRIRKLEGNTTKFVRNFVNLYNDMFETAEQAIKELSNTSVYDEYTNDVESFREYVNQQFKAIQLAYVEHLQRVKKVTRSSSPTLEEDSINLQQGSPLFKWENTAYEVDEDGEVFQKGSKAFVQLDQLIDQDQASAVLDQREDKTNIGDTRFAVLEKARELLDASKATLTDIKRVYNLKRIDVPVTNVMLLSYLPMQKKLSTHLKDQKVGFKAQDEYFNAVFSLEKMLTQAIDSTEYKWFGTNTLNLNSDLKDKTSLYSKIFENQQQVEDYLEWKKITRRLVTRKYRMQDIKSLQQSLKIKEEAKEDHVFFKDFLFTQFSLDRIRSLKKKGATRNVSLKELFMLEKYGNLTADQLEDAWHQDVEFVRKKYPNAKQILQDRKLNIISEEDYFEHKAWHKKRIKNIITAKNIERVQRTGSFSITELVKQGTIDSQDKLARVSQELKDYVQMLERHNFTYDVIYRQVTGKDGKLKNVEIPIKDLKKFPDVELTKIEQEEYIKGQKTDPLLKTTEVYKTTVQIAKRYGDNLVADLLKRVRNAEYTGDILTRTVIDDDLNVVEELDTYQVSKVAENESIEEISNTADQLPPEEEDAYYDSMINDDTGRTVPVNLDTYDEQDYGVEDFYPNDDNDYRASRVSGGFKSGVSSGANVKRWINQITRKWKFKPKVNIVNDVRYLPNPLRKRLLKKFGENVHLKGLYDNKSGTVYLFSDHLVDRDDVEFTFFHEVVGHLGMRGFLGQDFQNVLENLYKTNSVVRALADEKMETLNVGRLEGIEEALADLAGRGEQLSTVRRIIKFFTKGLRAIGMDSVADYIDKLTTDEIGYLLEKSFEFARDGGIKIFHGSPSAFRTHRNPIEIFARIPVKVDNKKTVQEINGYASYSHVTDTWTVFYNPDMTGLKQRDMPVQKTMANFNEAVEFLETVMGGKGKVEITHRSTTPFYEGGRQPNEFSNIYDRTRTEDGQRVSSFRRWIENVWQWTQNEYLPIFQAVRRAKNVNSAVDLRVFLQNNERRVADYLRRFKDEEVSEIFNLVETAGKKGATEDLLNLYLVATASEERNIQTLKNNNVPRDIIKEYIKIIRAGKLRDFFEIKEALKKKFPKQEKLINGLNLSGSGMSKYGHESYDGTFIRGYEDVIKSVESSAFAEEFKAIANILDFLGNEKIKLMLDAGLITLADAQKRRKAYKRYRAMAGMAENQDGDTDPFEAFKAMTGGALGKKFNIRSKDSRTATGRMGVAQNVLAQTLVSYQNAIIRAEKNRIAQKILHFLEDNYDPDFVQIAENQSIKIIDENGNESYSSEVNLIKDPSVFYARVKGVPVQMNFAFNEEGSFAQAINGFVYPPTKNILEYSVASVTKFTGRLLTTWNPFWVPVNFIRDIQTVYTNLDIDLGEDAGKEAMSDLFTAIRVSLYQRIKDWNPNPNYVKRFKFITQGKTPQYVKSFLMALLAKNAGLSYIGIGKEDKFKEMLDIYDEGRRAGGFTAFLNREGMDEQVAQIGRLISKMEDKGDGVKGFVLESTDQIRDFGKMMSGLLEFITIPMEVAPRLSAYKVARSRGLNPDKSANLSGEISVNFNMRGSQSLFRSFYLFFNPALQGTAKMAKMASQEPKRFMKASSFWIMLGLFSNFLARIFGGSDEEGDDLEKLPHYQRSTKFIIAPNMELGALPIAYGWNAFYSLGHFMLDPIIGNVTWGQTGKNILASSFEAFSPVAQGVGDAKTFQSGLIKAVAPTVSQPSFEYWFNENRFGTPIYKDRSFGQPSTSATQMAFRNVSPMAERFAVRLQELTGGNIFNQKGIDLNPAFIDHVFRNHLGGVPNEIYQSMARSQREKLGLDLTEDQTYWARKFGAFVPERRHVGLYLELKNKVLTLANEAEKLPIEAESLDTLFNNPIRKETILDEYPDVFAMRELINEVDNQLKDLNKQYNELNEYNKFVRLQEGQEDAMTKEAVIEMLNQINRSKEDLYGMTISILYENGYREGRKKPN